MITPTEHDKAEWSRLARAAYAARVNTIGHRYSAAAALRRNEPMDVQRFDQLQAGYRAWLVFGEWPSTEDKPAAERWHCARCGALSAIGDRPVRNPCKCADLGDY